MTANNDFFLMEGDKVVINPKVLCVPEFAKIYDEDRSQGKRKALKEFRYVYFMSDYKSEYNAYGLNKDSQLGLEIFNNKNYRPDPDVQAAMEKYEMLQNTPSMQYLKACRSRTNNLIKFLTNAEVQDKDKEGNYKNPFIQIDKVTKVLNELEDVVEKLEKWEKKVFEEEEDMQIRGGGKVNVFEDPQNAKWIGNK